MRVSNKNGLPDDVDSFLQDIVQLTGTISLMDVMTFEPKHGEIEKLRELESGEWAKADPFGDNTNPKEMKRIGRIVKKIVWGLEK